MKFDIDLVGKVGSMALINKPYRDINYNVLAKISRDLAPGMIWVTSGAMEIGRLDYLNRMGKELNGNYEEVKTDYCSQGQAILMNYYRQFIDSKYCVRQILVEHTHFNNEEKREHLKNLLLRCPSQRAIPIINYNDAVCNEETRKVEISDLLKKGKKVVQCVDNDETASQIACLVKAKTLLILSTLDGIYEDLEHTKLATSISGASVEETIANICEHQKNCRGASREGANGAFAKLEYIKAPISYGARVIIGSSRYGIKDLLQGNVPCTVIEVK